MKENHKEEKLQLKYYMYLLKKSVHKWAHTVQPYGVQGSTVHTELPFLAGNEERYIL